MQCGGVVESERQRCCELVLFCAELSNFFQNAESAAR
jgi:hypothetical protein